MMRRMTDRGVAAVWMSLLLASLTLAASCANTPSTTDEPSASINQARIQVRHAVLPSQATEYKFGALKLHLGEALDRTIGLQSARAGEVLVQGIWTVYYELNHADAEWLAEEVAENGNVYLLWKDKVFRWIDTPYAHGPPGSGQGHVRQPRASDYVQGYFRGWHFTEQSARALAKELPVSRNDAKK